MNIRKDFVGLTATQKRTQRLLDRGIDPRLYSAWDNMKRRCDPTHVARKHYGDRGICVCKRWEKFESFAADMGPHPGVGWSIDRKKGDQGYRKSNCRWATRTTQGRNTSRVRLTEKKAQEKSTPPARSKKI